MSSLLPLVSGGQGTVMGEKMLLEPQGHGSFYKGEEIYVRVCVRVCVCVCVCSEQILKKVFVTTFLHTNNGLHVYLFLRINYQEKSYSNNMSMPSCLPTYISTY
jgi:hypothetical protein